MNTKYNAIKTLYMTNRITVEGVKQAVVNGFITQDQCDEILALKK